MTQRVKTPAAKPADLSSISGTHTVVSERTHSHKLFSDVYMYPKHMEINIYSTLEILCTI